MVLLTKAVSEKLAKWVNFDPPAHEAAYRLITKTDRDPKGAIALKEIWDLTPAELEDHPPIVRRLWHALRSLSPEIMLPGDTRYTYEPVRSPSSAGSPVVAFLYVPRDMRKVDRWRAAHATVLFAGLVLRQGGPFV